VNIINSSGLAMEDSVESFLLEQNIPYQRSSSGKHEIDFILSTKDGPLYLECSNQNVPGSVEEKLPHKLWKYYKKYQFDNVILVTGILNINKRVVDHCFEITETYKFNLQILTLPDLYVYLYCLLSGDKISDPLERFYAT
jgi:hypothetical protein